MAPNLRAVGVEIELGRTKKGRFITVTRTVGDFGVTNVTNVTPPEKQGDLSSTGDARVTQGDDATEQEYHVNYDAVAQGDDGDDGIPPYSKWVDPNDLLAEAAADDEEVGAW